MKTIKAKLEKIIHEDHNLIKTEDAQKAVIKCLELFERETKEAAVEFALSYEVDIIWEITRQDIESKFDDCWADKMNHQNQQR
jgi:hypothetical protein